MWLMILLVTFCQASSDPSGSVDESCLGGVDGLEGADWLSNDAVDSLVLGVVDGVVVDGGALFVVGAWHHAGRLLVDDLWHFVDLLLHLGHWHGVLALDLN